MLRSRILSVGQQYFCRYRDVNLTPRLLCTNADQPSIPPAEQLTYRLATVEDFGQILHLSRGLFDGVDPFPYFFHEYQVDKDAAVYVAEHEGKLVGAYTAVMAGDKTAMINKHLRIDPDYRGRNIMWHLDEHLDRYMKYRHPTVTLKQRMLLSNWNNPNPIFKKFPEERMKKIYNVHYLFFSKPEGMPMPVDRKHFKGQIFSLQPCTQDTAARLSDDDLRQLLHKDYGQVSMHPYNMCRTDSLQLRTAGLRYIAIGKNEPAGVSLCSRWSASAGLVYHIDLHAADQTSLEHHVAHHVEQICIFHAKEKVYLLFSAPETFDREKIMKFCESTLGLPRSDRFPFDCGVICEMELHPSLRFSEF
ncbi:histidine N-acetyltransferase-like [Branchiostoma lanceolatum]|uniref:histidine N-acetyltransferase-like n=1 Tax=Branchiostoma lanceolatum TaxID=7740 RepID=UPI00345643E5